MSRWVKRGLLVEPPLDVPWSASHAALPATDIDDHGLRLYFSTRDDAGRSLLARAPLVVDGGTLAVGPVESEPLLPLGELGAFDDRGLTCGCVVREEGRVHIYYSGWSLGRTVPFYFYIGLGVSSDGGATFTRATRAPVFERNLVDPFLTASPSVLVEAGLWRAWYVSGTAWDERGHQYRIHYAESDDGIAWRRAGRVAIDYADESEYALGRPCVVRDADRYRMWFSHRGDTYRLGYAESADGLAWERRDEEARLDVSDEGWDSEMVEYPWVFDAGGRRFMLYNGNGYGASGIGYAVLEA